jgi:hypothetical protein
MKLVAETKINGEFSGWDGETVFELANGQKWQQARFKHQYRFKYMPRVKIWEVDGKHYLEVDCMTEMLPIKRIA